MGSGTINIDDWAEDDPARVYVTEVRKIPPLSAAEEIECIERVRKGEDADESAAVRLMETHLELVFSIAQRYQNDRMHILDLIQEGNLGLLCAVQALKDNPQRGFSDLATEHIEQAIQKAAAAQE